MSIYRKVIVKKYKHSKRAIGAFLSNFYDFPGTESFFAWIRIRKEFFQVLDPDSYQNDVYSPQEN